VKTCHFRIDIIDPTHDRRLIRSLSEVNAAQDGLILLHQAQGKISVLLPGIVNMTITTDELFAILCKKADLDPKKLDPNEYHLYAIRSRMSADVS
jgi:AMMECR1 domain-containing protein